MIGQAIGVYQVLSKLGEGGMGEVYRAKDTKLNRDVAIKVLPASFAADAERVARFTREAQVLASLNHPNIAQIHGIEESGAVRALVMELVEGEDLSDVIGSRLRAQGSGTKEHGSRLRAQGSGPKDDGSRLRAHGSGLPLDEALAIARQVADALEAAHEQGIIHRDLKPANIKVKADGTVKVLDFGLAKAIDSAQSSGLKASASMSPTITTPAMTQAGMILGTAAYMSPEQAKGRAVDKRADIWAFGAVLFEMLTGQRAFAGDDVTETLASVLKDTPAFATLPPSTPPRLRALIERCLERDLKMRLRDIGEARVELTKLASGQEPSAPAMLAPSRATSNGWWRGPLRAAAALAVGASAMLVATRWMATPTPPATVTFAEAPPTGTQFVGAPIGSPDGRKLAMIAIDAAGKTRLWTRELTDPSAHVIEAADGLTHLAWSPDSTQIAFASQGQVRRVPAAGGSASVVVAATPRGLVWLTDGDLLLSVDGQGFMRVPATGGTLRAAEGLTPAALRNLQFDYPAVSADGQLLLYAQFGGETGIYLARVDGTARRRIYSGEQSSAFFMGADLVAHAESKVLVAQRFNPKDLSLVGEAFPLGQNVGADDAAGSPAGVVAFVAGQRPVSQLTWFTRNGTKAGVVGQEGEYGEVEISRGGRWIVFSRADDHDGNVDIWLQPAAGGAPTRFTSDADIDHLFTISADERQVAWEAHANGALNLMRRPADGSTPAQLWRRWGRAGGPVEWSPDGRTVIYESQDGASGDNLWVVPADGTEPKLLSTVGGGQGRRARFSPDGRWIAFEGSSTGQSEIYVQRISGLTLVGGPIRVSEHGGLSPLWRHDGGELFFNNMGAVMASEFHTERENPASRPQLLFTIAGNSTPGFGYQRSLAVMPDGQRFLAIVATIDPTPHAATVMLNVRPDLKR